MAISLRVTVEDSKVEELLAFLERVYPNRLQDKIFLLQRTSAWLTAVQPITYLVNKAEISLDYAGVPAPNPELGDIEPEPMRA
jgi:hypothetical protein